MVNTDTVAVTHIQTPRGVAEYEGAARIDGVPNAAAPIPIEFLDIEGSSCGALLPTGNIRDHIEDVDVTCIDNGMPVVLLRSSDFGKTGMETPSELEADPELRARIERIRLAVGARMNLGDVTKKTVPKMSLISPARNGGTVSTRTFIPHRVHEAIGVLGAVSVATACLLEGSVGSEFVSLATDATEFQVEIEHRTGFFTVDIDIDIAIERGVTGSPSVRRVALLRTARKLMCGEIYVPSSDVWDGNRARRRI
jgi:4-oxalomesaconate tautomerase